MNKETDIQENLQYIAQCEGDMFKYDEVAIQKEYTISETEKSSLAIKILSIVGGFLATLAFLGFLFVAGLYESEGGLVIFGIIFIGVSIWLNLAFNKLITDTLSVSAYAIGYCLFAIGLSMSNVDENTISFLFIFIAIAALCIMQNYILSFISILIINGCFIFLIIDNHAYGIIHLYNAIILALLTFVFLNEAKLLTTGKAFSKLYNPFRIGLIFSLIFGLIMVGKKGLMDTSFNNLWISSFISIPLTIYVISIITRIIGVEKLTTKIIIYTLSTLILLPTAFSPSISGALLIILLSFLVNYKLGLSIGVIAFIYFISQYYYDLNYTLLTKSILLFSSGIVFLLFYIFSHKKLGSNEKV